MMSSTNNYLLLDGAQIDGLLQQVYRLQEAPECALLYQKTPYASLAESGPVLVRTQPGSSFFGHFQAHWQTTAGVHLISDAEPDHLHEHLRSLVHARLEHGGSVLFRYYDPRILPLWLESLSAEERDYCMGPVERFVIPDEAGQPAILKRTGSGRAPTPYADQPWLLLSAAKLDLLNQAKQAEFDKRLLQHLQNHFPDRLGALDASEQQRLVRRCRDGAALYGYSSAAEVVRWSGLVVLLGDDFPEAPHHNHYRALLAQPGRLPDQRLEDALLYAQYQQLQLAKETLP